MKLETAILAALLAVAGAAKPVEVTEGQVIKGGDCTVYFNSNANKGQGAWKKYSGQPDYNVMCAPTHTDGTPLSCVPNDMEATESGNGFVELAGTCKLSVCEGYDETDGIDVDNIPFGEDPGTRRVTICHRTCSTKNPWVRITIDYHAFEADDGPCAEDGNDHTRHDAAIDCSGYSGDYSIFSTGAAVSSLSSALVHAE